MNCPEIGLVFSDNAKALIPLSDIKAIQIKPAWPARTEQAEVRIYFSPAGFIRADMNKEQLSRLVNAVIDACYYTAVNLREKKEEKEK